VATLNLKPKDATYSTDKVIATQGTMLWKTKDGIKKNSV